MAHQNPRLARLDARSRSIGGKGYRDAGHLYDCATNFANSIAILWEKDVSLSPFQVGAFHEHYRDMREALVSLGTDVSDLPEKLRIKVKGGLAA
jgi:hypothetical protein